MSCVLLWTLWDARAAAWKQADQAAGNLALSLERDVGRIVNALDLSLRFAAQGMKVPGIAAMVPAVRQSILFDRATTVPASTAIYVTDAAGTDIYSSLTETAQPINVADREYFHQLQARPDAGLVVAAPLRSRIGNHWTLPVARAVERPDGGFAGVAVGGIRLSDLTELFGAFDVGRQGVITLLGADGRLIVRSPFLEREIGRDLSSQEFMRRLAVAPSGSNAATSRTDGIRRLYSYRRVAGLPLIVSVGLSTQEIYAEWRARTAVVAVAFLALLALASALALALRRELRRRGDAERVATASGRGHAAALARLDVLFKHSRDTMLVARVEADGGFVYEAVNPIWEGATGVSELQAVGKSPPQCQSAAVCAILLPAWRACVRERHPIDAAYRSADQREWESVVAPVLDQSGRIHKLIAVGRDVTKRNQLEAKLRGTQRMEAIGQLTTGVAHDFNNLLQTVLGGLEVLRDQPGLDAEGLECVDAADAAARRGAALTHRLLAFSRKQSLAPVALEPGEIVANVEALLTRTLGSRIRVECEVAESTWPLRADGAQLEDCLFTLALNARDAMPDGGVLRLRVRNARPGDPGPADLPTGDYVRFTVDDEGLGISPDLLGRVFEPFFTTKAVGRGTGLGLSMVQGFARQSGGDVRIDSAPGRGTTVGLWLPRATDALGVARAAAPSRQPGRGQRRVLVVDDEPGVLRTISLFLTKAGFDADAVESGEAALDRLLAGETYELLVTDQSMPGLTGCELIGEAARLRPGLPTMLVTGYDRVSGLERLEGRVTVLRKPFERLNFLHQVEALLAGVGQVAVSAADVGAAADG